jgi:WD40 repeat protein
MGWAGRSGLTLLLVAMSAIATIHSNQAVQPGDPIVLRSPATGAVTFLSFLPDGRLFFATPTTGFLSSADRAGKPITIPFGSDVNPLSKAFSPPHSLIALNASDGVTARILLLNVETKRIRTLRPTVHGAGGANLAVSGDGSQLVSAQVQDGQLFIERWGLPDGRSLANFSFASVVSPSGHLAISPRGELIAVGTHRRTREDPFPAGPVGAILICRATGQLLARIATDDIPRGLAFSADDRRLYAGSAADANVHEYDAESGAELRVLSTANQGRSGNTGGRGAAGSTSAMTMSFDGARLATASTSDTRVRVWDPAAGAVLRTLSADSPIYSIAFDAKRGRIAAGTQSGAIYIWRVD